MCVTIDHVVVLVGKGIYYMVAPATDLSRYMYTVWMLN